MHKAIHAGTIPLSKAQKIKSLQGKVTAVGPLAVLVLWAARIKTH